MLLAVFDDQIGLDLHVAPRTCLGGTQAALVKLIGNRLADPLLGQVALDTRVIRAILQGRFFPAPTAVGREIPAGVEVMVDLVIGAGAEQQDKGKRNKTAEHGFSPLHDQLGG